MYNYRSDEPRSVPVTSTRDGIDESEMRGSPSLPPLFIYPLKIIQTGNTGLNRPGKLEQGEFGRSNAEKSWHSEIEGFRSEDGENRRENPAHIYDPRKIDLGRIDAAPIR